MSHKYYRVAPLAAAITAALSFSVSAVGIPTAYEIVEGPLTLDNTDSAVGVSTDGAALFGESQSATATPSTSIPFLGSSFIFQDEAFISINGQIEPAAEPNVDPETVDPLTPRISAFLNGTQGTNLFGNVTAPMQTVETTATDSDESSKRFYRDYELRAFIKTPDALTFLNPSADSITYNAPLEPDGDDSTTESNETVALTVGGLSSVSGIDGDLAVGSSTVELTDSAKTALNNCVDTTIAINDDANKAKARAVCVQASQNNGQVAYQTQASFWSIGSVVAPNSDTGIEPTLLPLGFDPADGISASSQAFAINSASQHVVGQSTRVTGSGDEQAVIAGGPWATYWNITSVVNSERQLTNSDVTFVGPTFADDERYRASDLVAINDKGIAIGNLALFDGDLEFGFINTAENQQQFTVPTLSSSLPVRVSSINNNDIVVGYQEVQSVASFANAKHGFIYDLDLDDSNTDQAPTNLNHLLTCESLDLSDEPLEDGRKLANIIITNASHIDDDGNIAATVTQRVETDGQTQVLSRAVLLKPVIDGTSACDPSTVAYGQDFGKHERQGASFGWWALLLAPMVWLRRRFG
ncbi:DUF3466 family protein [Ferrimonas senticii]|uniref:DUF3466 family protein n=1 Tax=Ferrimonas senticii TaxID=394566 RepID=UPI0004023BAF|nr:DUF3466 family protein [Ferrimonas senticii]